MVFGDVVVVFIGNHIGGGHEFAAFQVLQVDVSCPLLQALSKRHDNDIAQFVIGEVGQPVMHLLNIAGSQPDVWWLGAQTGVGAGEVIWPQILVKVVCLSWLGRRLPRCFLVQPGILARTVRVRTTAAAAFSLFHHGFRVLFFRCHVGMHHSLWRNFSFLRHFVRVLVFARLLLIGLLLLICPGGNHRTLLWIISTMNLFSRSLLMSFGHVLSPLSSTFSRNISIHINLHYLTLRPREKRFKSESGRQSCDCVHAVL